DQDPGADPHLPGDQRARERDDDAGAQDHQGGRDPHGEAVDHRVGDGQGGAEAEHRHQHRVLAPDAAQEVFARGGRLHGAVSFRYAARTGPSSSTRRSMMRITAVEEMVAPLIMSTSCGSPVPRPIFTPFSGALARPKPAMKAVSKVILSASPGVSLLSSTFIPST